MATQATLDVLHVCASKCMHAHTLACVVARWCGSFRLVPLLCANKAGTRTRRTYVAGELPFERSSGIPGSGSALCHAYFNYSELRVLRRERGCFYWPLERASAAEGSSVFRIGRRRAPRLNFSISSRRRETSLSPSEIRRDCDSRKSRTYIAAWLIRVWNPSTREIDNASCSLSRSSLSFHGYTDWTAVALLLWFVVSGAFRLSERGALSFRIGRLRRNSYWVSVEKVPCSIHSQWFL